ncbi:MAG: leucine-rich repeat protein [Oscillospiraceae bacterium]|nr:leucine-rich repeat protein [Oscillospiraceae bacterium]
MKIKRLLSYVLSVVMLATALAGGLTTNVFATASDTAETENTITVDYQNMLPVYSGALADNEISVTVTYSPATLYTSTSSYVSEDDAAAAIREYMKRRVSKFTIYVKTLSNPTTTNIFSNLIDSAMNHTGDPTEGDYLRWQFGGFSSNISYFTNGDGYYYCTIPFDIPYYTTAQQEAQLDVEIANLLNSLNLYNASDFDKVKGIYDYICSNVTYDHSNVNDESNTLKHTAYAALINKTAVCQGYALLFYRLALELGVDCRLISGDSHNERHGWNIVRIDGVYYNLDTTWDAGRGPYGYDYFLKCEANFGDHKRDPQYDNASFHQRYPMSAKDHVNGVFIVENGVLVAYNGYDSYIVIPDGIVGIADGVFSLNRLIVSVVIPNSVTFIGKGAFSSCSRLTSINIPESVTSIGDEAFAYCESLQEITIPQGITSLSKGIFDCCTSLNKVNLPSNLTTIGEGAFRFCKALTSIDIPAGVTTIGKSAFEYCTSLISITVPEGVTSISDWVFYSCKSLSNINLPSTLTAVGNCAFDSCLALETIEIPDSVLTLGNSAFRSCTNLKTVKLPKELTVINEFTFDSCESLSSIEIPDGVTEICKNAFSGADSLENIVIPASVESVGQYSFNCSLKSITFLSPDTVIFSYNDTINADAVIYGYTSSTARKYAKAYSRQFVALDPNAEIPLIDSGTCGDNLMWELNEDGVLTISGTGEMTSCPWIEEYSATINSVVICEGVTTICDRAFEHCTQLSSVTFPSTLTEIGERAFFYCNRLASPEFPTGLTKINDMAFYACYAFSEVILPDSVTYIGNSAFSSCKALVSVKLPANLTTISERMFDNCTKLVNINIPDSVTTIEQYAFSTCSSLKQITIPESVTNIGVSIFRYCSCLSSVDLPNNLTSIPGRMFEYCTSLTHIDIPESVTSIGYSAFYECSKLSEISLPENLNEIQSSAFAYCSALTSVNIPASVEMIGYGAFSDCENLQSIYLYNQNVAIDDKYHYDFVPQTTVVYGYKDSTAQAYALENGRAFYILLEDGTICGDLDSNLIVDNIDAIYLLYSTIFGEQDYALNQDCDFDNNGVIDNNDAIYLLYHTIFGMESYPL